MDLNNLNGLTSLLSNVDPNMILSLLGNSNLGNKSNNSKEGQNGLNNVMGLLKNVDLTQVFGLMNGLFPQNTQKGSSGNQRDVHVGMRLLNEVKPMMDQDKRELIDMVVQLYRIYKLLG